MGVSSFPQQPSATRLQASSSSREPATHPVRAAIMWGSRAPAAGPAPQFLLGDEEDDAFEAFLSSDDPPPRGSRWGGADSLKRRPDAALVERAARWKEDLADALSPRAPRAASWRVRACACAPLQVLRAAVHPERPSLTQPLAIPRPQVVAAAGGQRQ